MDDEFTAQAQVQISSTHIKFSHVHDVYNLSTRQPRLAYLGLYWYADKTNEWSPYSVRDPVSKQQGEDAIEEGNGALASTYNTYVHRSHTKGYLLCIRIHLQSLGLTVCQLEPTT